MKLFTLSSLDLFLSNFIYYRGFTCLVKPIFNSKQDYDSKREKIKENIKYIADKINNP
jgi:hypothetical protein